MIRKYNPFIIDELMRNLDQIKSIVHAKWTDSNGGEAAALTQEELTQEAEKILKRSTSKSKKR